MPVVHRDAERRDHERDCPCQWDAALIGRLVMAATSSVSTSRASTAPPTTGQDKASYGRL